MLKVRVCSIEGCDGVHQARGWCAMHYTRWVRHGDPLSTQYASLDITEKACSGCGDTKPVSEFYARPDSPGRYRARCKRCMAGDNKRHYENGGAAARQAWAEANREKVNAWSRRYYRANRVAHAALTDRHRALKYSTQTEVIRSTDIFERDEWVCGICGGAVDRTVRHPDPWSASLDHIIPLSKGGTHTRENVQLAHFRCNVRKSAKVPCPVCNDIDGGCPCDNGVVPRGCPTR